MPDFVICACVNEPLTQADIETELWDILGTASDTDGASHEDITEDSSWNVVPLQQKSDSCSEEVRPGFYFRLFCVSLILYTWVILD
jgi:hypothetical protein